MIPTILFGVLPTCAVGYLVWNSWHDFTPGTIIGIAALWFAFYLWATVTFFNPMIREELNLHKDTLQRLRGRGQQPLNQDKQDDDAREWIRKPRRPHDPSALPGMITRRLSDGTCRVEHLQQDGTYKVKDYPRPEPPRPK